MTSSSEIKDWYNSFTLKQRKTGTNLRHFTIFNKAIQRGLKKHHTVLEIGCGIGTLTGLLNEYLTTGKLVATDISDESVRMAKESISKSARIDFIVTDMSDFTYPDPFDFIILPDVLEHIPIDSHAELFKILSKLLKKGGFILINIPHPRYINYIRANQPEKLQIVDQALSASDLMNVAYKADLILESYESHSIFNSGNDYALIAFSNITEPTFQPIKKRTIILKKTLARFKSTWAHIIN